MSREHKTFSFWQNLEIFHHPFLLQYLKIRIKIHFCNNAMNAASATRENALLLCIIIFKLITIAVIFPLTLT